VIELVGWSLVHSLWEGALIALALFGFLRLVDPRRSAVRYLASALALLGLVILPPLTASRMTGSGMVAAGRLPDQVSGSPAETIGESERAVQPKKQTLALDPVAESNQSSNSEEIAGQLPDERSRSVFITALLPRLSSFFPWLVALWTIGV